MIDLDTRLKMLMKDKTGAMPAFLLQELSGSDNESEKDAEALAAAAAAAKSVIADGNVDDDDEAPLSRPPSPFLSPEHYHRNLRNRKKKSGKSKQPRPDSKNSDRMSLSRSELDSTWVLELQGLLEFLLACV